MFRSLCLVIVLTSFHYEPEVEFIQTRAYCRYTGTVIIYYPPPCENKGFWPAP